VLNSFLTQIKDVGLNSNLVGEKSNHWYYFIISNKASIVSSLGFLTKKENGDYSKIFNINLFIAYNKNGDITA